MSNELSKEGSPYLQQHAHNPVHWKAWSEESLAYAKAQNKPILVSIGYSACHWCHVMERESFEDADIAAVMNENFVCIKVDREERPDIDQVYMDAVQLMNGHGGWPLNAFCTPEGVPVYGGTYFQPQRWKSVCLQIARLWQENPDTFYDYSEQLKEGIQGLHTIQIQQESVDWDLEISRLLYAGFEKHYDTLLGGMAEAPKFPMPVVWEYVLDYGVRYPKSGALEQIGRTLDAFANLGLYDQVGGGFFRYSVDAMWKIPHFEKMLYDNAQLISLFSKAWRVFRKPEYKILVEETLRFWMEEMRSGDGCFYAALDADSEGVEGKYYVWTEEELKHTLDEALFPLAKLWFDIGGESHWEHGLNHFQKCKSVAQIALETHQKEAEVQQQQARIIQQLKTARQARIRPGLDNKIILSWNALMLEALAESEGLGLHLNPLEEAERCWQGLWKLLRQQEGWRRCNTNPAQAFSEDYLLLCKACLRLFFVSQEEKWLKRALELKEELEKKFLDSQTGFLRFAEDSFLSPHYLLTDQVVPGGNSLYAHIVWTFSQILDSPAMEEQAKKLCRNVLVDVQRAPRYYAGWCKLILELNSESQILVISGPDFRNSLNTVIRGYYPDLIVLSSDRESEIHTHFKSRINNRLTVFYVCKNKACSLPLESLDEALKILNTY